jgi:hypothetical protein
MMVLKQDERSRTIITIVLFGLSIATYFLVWMFASRGTCPTEPFVSQSGDIGGIIATVQRVGGVLLNPSTWTERIEMYTMTPVELARHYLNKTKSDVEDDETV